jgi:hypothetical protein
LTELALFGERGRAQSVREKARVAMSSDPTFSGKKAVTVALEIGEDLAVERSDNGALGNLDEEVSSPFAVLFLALPVCTVTGTTERVVFEREKRHDVVGGFEDDFAAVAAVAAVGTALFDVRLTAERN